MSFSRFKAGMAAAAVTVSLMAVPQAAQAIDYCTHSKSTDGIVNITTVTYLSGSWQYVGSTLYHVHSIRVDKYNAISHASSTSNETRYCGS